MPHTTKTRRTEDQDLGPGPENNPKDGPFHGDEGPLPLRPSPRDSTGSNGGSSPQVQTPKLSQKVGNLPLQLHSPHRTGGV